MTPSGTHRTVEAVWRMESARIIGGLARVLRDVGLAEELAQDALVAALEQWPVERICAELGVTRDQIYVSKSRVTRRLRELMKDMLGEDGAGEHV